MNQRPALYSLASRYELDAATTRRLFGLAGLDAEPAGLALRLRQGLALLAAGLVGLGLILWVAANWDFLGRFGQLALLQGLVLAACLGALAVPAGRPAFALLALLAVGALLAYVGQTYQTGADPWQLFAWWGLLCLPLTLAARSDALWTAWALVAMTAVALWAQTYASHPWESGPDSVEAYALAWGAAVLLAVGLGPPLRRITGAGLWALRTATTLAVALVTWTALFALFFSETGTSYWLGLLVLSGAALALALPGAFDIGGLSAVALGLDTLLVAGLGRWLLHDYQADEPIGPLLVLGFAAAGLLAGSVVVLLRLARYRAGE
jgi:hypothetical protein